ncbi:hypothetical protein B0H12DRAFT_1017183, partial [Mycena haematopus]
HPGKMVQSGFTAGPRHAHVFGPGKCYTKKIDSATAIDHDIDTIGAFTLAWNIARAILPTEIIDKTTEAVGEIGLPTISTRNVAAGTGYRLSIGGKDYDFPLHDRAPCEGLFTQDYSA